MNQNESTKKIGPELITSILREAKKPLTTRQLQQETQKRVPHSTSSNVVVLNPTIRGTIKGKSTGINTKQHQLFISPQPTQRKKHEAKDGKFFPVITGTPL